jgi:hypothetical protein
VLVSLLMAGAAPTGGGPEATLALDPRTAPLDTMEQSPTSRADERRRRTRRRWVTLLVPPFVAFLFAEVLLYVSAVQTGTTGDFFTPPHWARYDSGIYLEIAAHGLILQPCVGPAYPPHSACGTVGFAPLYSGLIAALGHLGLSLPVAGMVLTILFAYLTLQVLWILIGPAWSFSALCCLALGACFPGMVYYYALFPVSLLTFFALVCLLLFIRRRFWLAGLAGAFCCWAFAIGPLIGVVLLVAALLVERGPGFWKVAVRTAGVTFAGFAAWLVVNQIWVGQWHAYFRGQSKYANGLHDPISVFITAFTGGPAAPYPLQDPNPGYDYLIPKAQSAFIAALVIGLVIWTLRRRPVSRTEWVVLSYTVIFWLLPLVDGASLSRYRMEALLLPCAALCTRVPRPVQAALVVTSAILAVGLANLFTRYQLI